MKKKEKTIKHTENFQSTYERYINIFEKNDNKPHKIIMEFYRGNTWNLIKTAVLLVFQRSPMWVTPLVTTAIIGIATDKPENGMYLILIQLAIALFFLLQNLGSAYMATKYLSKINRDIEATLRNVMVRKLQYLSIMFHKDSQSGRLQSKVIRDVENIYELLNQLPRLFFFFALDTIVIIVVCLNKSPIILLFFLVVIPLSVWMIRVFRKSVRESNSDFRQGVEVTQGAVAQMLEMIPVTRAHGLQETEIHKMENVLNETAKRGYRLDLVNAFFGASNWIMFQVCQILCLVFTGALAYYGKITLAEVVLYQTYFTQIIGQVNTIINVYPQISKGMESVRSIGDVIEATSIERNNSIIPLNELKGNVVFKDVEFHYHDSKELVLKGIDFEVKQGESIAFVGSSGGGKTTMLNLLIGFIKPTSGKILIDGIHMSNLNMNEYRTQIAVVPQNTLLFSGSIKENICYGLSEITDEEVLNVMHEVGLDGLIESQPEGIHTVLGEHGDKLSGGQRQRIAIARALIRKPKMIIFDEATSALDSVSERKVQDATNRMMKQCTTFIVAHRLSTIRNVDRIVVIVDGNIAEMGNYEELMDAQGVFYNMEQATER